MTEISKMKKEEIIANYKYQKALVTKLQKRNNEILAEVRFLYRQIDFIIVHLMKAKDSAIEVEEKKMGANKKYEFKRRCSRCKQWFIVGNGSYTLCGECKKR